VLSAEKEAQILDVLAERFPNQYLQLSDEEVQEILDELGIKATTRQICELYKQFLREKVASSMKQLVKAVPLIVKLYDEENAGILEIAESLDFAPIIAFRALLIGRNMTLEQIELVMQSRDGADFPFLSKHDNEQLKMAQEADSITRELLEAPRAIPEAKGQPITPNEKKRKKNASDFEKKVGKKLTEMGVKFTTEEELINKMGATYATPDFLIVDGVMIEGSKVFWIDAKQFYGSDVVAARVLEQATRYNEMFGPGMLVFSLGFTQSLQDALPDVKLVSAAELGI